MKCCDKCRPLNSARMFKNRAPILGRETVRALLREKRGCKIIESGAGCLRNSLFLLKAGFDVSVLEVAGMDARFPDNYAEFRKRGGTLLTKIGGKNRFRLAVATFVIETICDRTLRNRIIRCLCRSLDSSGCLIISVRGPSDLVTALQKGKRCSDGYLTPGYSFARSYTCKQLRRLLVRSGFRKVQFLHRKEIGSPELVHALAWRR